MSLGKMLIANPPTRPQSDILHAQKLKTEASW